MKDRNKTEELLPGIEPAKPAGLGGDGLTHLVSFRLDGQLYALSLNHVECALRMVAVTPVPETPPWVLGVIDMHGQVTPVVDLRQRFGQPPKEPTLDDRLLVVQALEQTVALMVDEVTEVLEVPAHQVGPPAELLSQSRPLAAVIRGDGGLILVLDVTRLLPPRIADCGMTVRDRTMSSESTKVQNYQLEIAE